MGRDMLKASKIGLVSILAELFTGDTNQCERQVQKVLLGLVSRNPACLLQEFWPAQALEERGCRSVVKPVI